MDAPCDVRRSGGIFAARERNVDGYFVRTAVGMLHLHVCTLLRIYFLVHFNVSELMVTRRYQEPRLLIILGHWSSLLEK